jgi:hypothetical protein
MKIKILSWLVFTICCFLVMLIGFDIKVSISVSIIVGYICVLLNEIIFFQKYGDK